MLRGLALWIAKMLPPPGWISKFRRVRKEVLHAASWERTPTVGTGEKGARGLPFEVVWASSKGVGMGQFVMG